MLELSIWLGGIRWLQRTRFSIIRQFNHRAVDQGYNPTRTDIETRQIQRQFVGCFFASKIQKPKLS